MSVQAAPSGEQAAQRLDPEDLVGMLHVDEAAPDRFAARPRAGNRQGSVFGGQIVGQAMMAAGATTDRPPHAIFTRFFRPGRTGEPVEYLVNRDHEGASFAGRRVSVMQDRAIADVMISYHAPESAFEHLTPWSAPPPDPESLKPLRVAAESYDRPGSTTKALNYFRAMEVRPLNAGGLLGGPSAGPHGFWIRALRPLGDRPDCWAAAIAFLSDFLLAGAGVLHHSRHIMSPRLFGTTLNHTIWLHEVVDPSQWLYEEMESPWGGGARTLNIGRMFTADGRLVATTVQEALLRSARA
jgi:acyl-CoA thioesterase-2